MLDVRRAVDDHAEAGLFVRANARVGRGPILGRLGADGAQHHCDRGIEASERFFL
jgi:hypothetical protein